MRYLPLFGVLFLCTNACAQQEIFHYEPLYAESLRSFIVTEEKTSSFYLIAIDKDYVDRIYITPSAKANLLHQGNLQDERFRISKRIDEKTQKLYFQNKYIGGTVRGNKMLDVLQHRNLADLLFVETDLSTGNSVCTDTIKAIRKEDLVFTYTRNDHIYLVEQPKNKSYLLFHSKAFGKKAKTDTLTISLPAIGKAGNDILTGRINDFSDLTLGENVEVLPNNLWLPIHALNYRNKAFVQKDKFIITLNANDLSTWLISIDLNSLQYTVDQYKDPTQETKLKGPASNTSLVIDSFLVKAITNDKTIYCSIYNINSGKLLYTQTITNENFGQVSTSPMLKVGDFWSRSNLSEVSLEEFISKSTENQLTLTGYEEGDQLYLTFGSRYKRLVNATFFANVLTLGLGGFAEAKPPATVYFHTSFRLPDFTPSKRSLKNLVWDKMLHHVWANQQTAKDVTLFNMNGFYYIGYFSIRKHEYVIHRFNEKME